MIEKIRVVLLLIPGIIHLLPLSGLLAREKLSDLYGIPFTDPNLLILMQHRSVLFGLLGAFLVFSAFRSELQVLAITAGLISAASFMAIALSIGGYNAAIQRVVVADVVAVLCLTGAAATFLLPGSVDR